MFVELVLESVDYLKITLFLPNQSTETLSDLGETIATRCEDKVKNN